MNVRLVALTKPIVEREGLQLSAEEFISYCARVSNPSNQMNTETAPRLLAYCIRHGHWSIFETVSMTVEIETSRAIAAQILRHRSFTFQEFSQRYAQSTDFEDIELRLQDPKNRQSSGEKFFDPLLKESLNEWIERAADLYHGMLDRGISKETARMILPLCTRTRLYMTGSVRSWIHYLEQRCDPATQKEHREVAHKIRAIFDQQFPTISAALKEAKP